MRMKRQRLSQAAGVLDGQIQHGYDRATATAPSARVSAPHEKDVSIILAFNIAFIELGSVLGDAVLARVILDRLLQTLAASLTSDTKATDCGRIGKPSQRRGSLIWLMDIWYNRASTADASCTLPVADVLQVNDLHNVESSVGATGTTNHAWEMTHSRVQLCQEHSGDFCMRR